MARQRNGNVGTLDTEPQAPDGTETRTTPQAPETPQAPPVDRFAALAARAASGSVDATAAALAKKRGKAAAPKLLVDAERVKLSVAWCRDASRVGALEAAYFAACPAVHLAQVKADYAKSSWTAVYKLAHTFPHGEHREALALEMASYIAQHGVAFAECRSAAEKAALAVADGNILAGAEYWSSVY